MPNFWIYILGCSNGSFYTGYTINLIQRYLAHKQGLGSKYTRSFPPLFLAQAWPIYGEKSEAMRIEKFIKQMDKETKQMLIDNPYLLEKMVIETLDV